ncbi:tetratricopeptide repeat protein [Novosphingobium jiangmenense]|uniref:Sel1 repeat family protein n=1 Tax=Novosphingobium jiangmenense TaxID=2791981 RepID=A0ABS0HE06_9SPHN|nr:sel1 repeat family protein [Novosphingobium jiangmenense]
MRKFKGNQSVETVLCRGADGVLREQAREIGASGNAFRGRLQYAGRFNGTAQPVTRQNNVSLSLQSLLRNALREGSRTTQVSGDMTLSLDVTGQSARGTVTLRGTRTQSWAISGNVSAGHCVLADSTETLVLDGTCGTGGFGGTLTIDPERGTRYRLKIEAQLTRKEDFDTRDLASAAERQRNEEQAAAERIRAEQWYKEKLNLADAGDVEAMYTLAEAFDGKIRWTRIARNPEQRLLWLSRASQRNHPFATYKLAFAYSEGDGVTQDFTRAMSLFRRCGEMKGEVGPYCLDSLGVMYWNGEGVPQNRAAARQIWQRCARTNSSCADRLRNAAN